MGDLALAPEAPEPKVKSHSTRGQQTAQTQTSESVSQDQPPSLMTITSSSQGTMWPPWASSIRAIGRMTGILMTSALLTVKMYHKWGKQWHHIGQTHYQEASQMTFYICTVTEKHRKTESDCKQETKLNNTPITWYIAHPIAHAIAMKLGWKDKNTNEALQELPGYSTQHHRSIDSHCQA